jgi:hypothetical protein
MEPFVSRDGALLFFNSSNAPGAHTDIYWARLRDSAHADLIGPVAGANSSALDGVASVAADGAFSFISTRAYDKAHATVWLGRWTGAAVTDAHSEAALSPGPPPAFNMDAEISADGARLYYTDNVWRPFGPPKSSVFRVAVRRGSHWRIDAAADAWFSQINDPGGALVYAAGVSADERAFYFTRLTRQGLFRAPHLEIMVATRPDPRAPFSAPAKIPSIAGFAEGPSVAPDGSIYFHQKRAGRFVIMRAPYRCGPPP